jgi:hypothetical protein
VNRKQAKDLVLQYAVELNVTEWDDTDWFMAGYLAATGKVKGNRHKICSKCKKLKHVTSFHTNRPECIKCRQVIHMSKLK